MNGYKLITLLYILCTTSIHQSGAITLERDKNWLILHDERVPTGKIRINYLEAYCRPNSTDADWHDTTIGHKTDLTNISKNKKNMQLSCTLSDGVIIKHDIRSSEDEVIFEIKAHNPTAKISQAHWAQPCIRLGEFTGFPHKGKELNDYLPKCFIFINGKLERMNQIRPWAMNARYTPGQVWCPENVPRTDVNPRPLSSLIPSNSLIGCFSKDEELIFAVAFEPYQELFQGVARCLHSDFRIGGLKPSETKRIKGKIYILENQPKKLLARYEKDFSK